MSNPVYEGGHPNVVPFVKNYTLDKRFLRKTKNILIAALVFTIVILIIFLLIRPGHLLGDLQKDSVNDPAFDYVIYTHIGAYSMSLFSLALLVGLLDYNKLTTNMIIYPSFVFALKVLALAGYYFYYIGTNKHNYNFKRDYMGFIYIVTSVILFSLYMSVFITAIQEKRRIVRNNLKAEIHEAFSIKDLIEHSYDHFFGSVRLNPVTEHWFKAYISSNIKEGGPVEEMKQKIDEEMNQSRELYNEGEKFFSRPLPQQDHNLYTSFLNNFYSGGTNDSNIMNSSTVKMNLRGNKFLNPKLIFYINELVSKGENTPEKVLNYLPLADSDEHDGNGDRRARISNFVNQIKRHNIF